MKLIDKINFEGHPKRQWNGKRYKFKNNIKQRFWNKVNKTDYCWEWTGSLRQNCGYGQFSIGGYPEFAHRVSWIIHFNEYPNEQVLHKCDNRKCIRPDHLFLGNQKENIKDMISKERDKLIGSRNHSAILNEETVLKIREEYKNTEITQTELANKYKVDRQTINDAILRKTWKHI